MPNWPQLLRRRIGEKSGHIGIEEIKLKLTLQFLAGAPVSYIFILLRGALTTTQVLWDLPHADYEFLLQNV
jgi:hypothetical protein